MTLKVIGAGFGRTGTASLKVALDQLGFGPCYHMSEVVSNNGHMDLWLEAAAGNFDWSAIFKHYQSTVDFPASNYWRELLAFYPDAKVILSLRDAEKWFASTQKTIFSKRLYDALSGSKWGTMVKATIDDHIGPDFSDRDAVIAAYNAHNEAVKSALGPDKLLIFEAKDGWQPLCGFLRVPVPEGEYPRINSSAEFGGVFALLSPPIGERIKAGLGAPDGPIHDEIFKG